MKRRALIAALFALVPFLAWRIAEACAPVFAVAVFHFKRHPDLPRAQFINGNLGVIQPTWARSYLILSYRYLSGIGLDSAERDQARDYYKDRDTQWWDRTGTDWYVRWQKARDRVPGIAYPVLPMATQGKFAFDEKSNSFSLNCAEDAYRNAVYTLENRTRRFGLASAAVREWTTGQNAVFANCSGLTRVIPGPAAAGLPGLILADRTYQIAAAHFYAKDYAEARRRFAEIARDANSPWSEISRYLVIRTLLRSGDPPSSDLVTEAQAILANPKLTAIHSITANLLDRHAVEQDDLTYFHLLGRLLARRGQGNGLRDSLWNYNQLYDHFIGDADPNPVYDWDRTNKPANSAPFADNELSTWIFHLQRSTPASGRLALERWQRTRSLPWLIAALTHANAATANSSGLLEAARTLPPASPGYFTAAYHVNRLLIESGDKPAAREGIDKLLAISTLDASSASRFRDLRLVASPNLTEFLRFAVRRPLLITDTEDLAEVPQRNDWFKDLLDRYPSHEPRLTGDAATLINHQVPQRLLTEAALDSTLPAPIQREFLMTAFTRAALLDLEASALAQTLGTVDPKLTPLTKRYLDAPTPEDRRFAAAFLLLHQPEANPLIGAGITRDTAPGRLDSYRDNWWCPLDKLPDAKRPGYWFERFEESRPARPTLAPAFLSPQDLAETTAEHRRLATQPSSIDFLGGAVLAYAATHPNDPRLPEALHLTVRGARVSCSGKDSWKTTRAAFRLLHAHFPNSTWARKTQTWWRDY